MVSAEGANLKGWQIYFNNFTIKGRRNVSETESSLSSTKLWRVCVWGGDGGMGGGEEEVEVEVEVEYVNVNVGAVFQARMGWYK